VENTIEERMLRLQDVKKGARIIIYPFFLIHYLNKHAYVLSRIGRCGSRRRYRCQTQQVKCQGDQSCACSPFSAISFWVQVFLCFCHSSSECHLLRDMYRLPNSLRTAAMIDTQIAIHAQPLVESQVAISTCSARYIACYIACYCI
jgi:hypothetical protein